VKKHKKRTFGIRSENWRENCSGCEKYVRPGKMPEKKTK